MKTYQITLTSADIPYVLEAIGLRAMSLQHEIQRQIQETEQRLLETQKPIVVPQAPAQITPDAEVEAWHKEIQKVAKKSTKTGSRAKKKAHLLKLIKENPDLSTAEIARRAGVSYVTAHKARKA